MATVESSALRLSCCLCATYFILKSTMADGVVNRNESPSSGASSLPRSGDSTVGGAAVRRVLNYPFRMYFDDIMSSW